MNLQLTQEQEMIVGMVRRFVKEEIQPREINLDPDADELPEADKALLVAKVKEMGLYGLDIPSEYGGPDLDMVTRTLIAIELSQHRAGLYTPCYGVFGGAGLAQLYEATDEQKDNYLYPNDISVLILSLLANANSSKTLIFALQMTFRCRFCHFWPPQIAQKHCFLHSK